MVDSQGITGWAPASFLFPMDEEDSQKEWEENQQLIGYERGTNQKPTTRFTHAQAFIPQTPKLTTYAHVKCWYI